MLIVDNFLFNRIFKLKNNNKNSSLRSQKILKPYLLTKFLTFFVSKLKIHNKINN